MACITGVLPAQHTGRTHIMNTRPTLHTPTGTPLPTGLDLSRWGKIVALDDRILRRLCKTRTASITALFDGMCRLLDPTRVPMVILALVVCGAGAVAEVTTVSLILSSTLVVALKRAVKRARPSAALQAWVPPDRFSFPSGHTAAAFAMAFALAPSVSPGMFFVLVGIAFVVAYARMYIGVHYPLDVLAGATVGIVVGIVTAGIMPTVLEYADAAPLFAFL